MFTNPNKKGLNKKVKDANGEINKLLANVFEKEQMISQKEQMISQKEQMISQKEQMISQKDQAIEDKDNQIARSKLFDDQSCRRKDTFHINSACFDLNQ